VYQDLSAVLLSWEVELALSEGPFEGEQGIRAHFDKGKKKMAPQKLTLETQRDLSTSEAPLLRNIAVHKPDVVFREGQGGIIALAVCRPLQVEEALQDRNVQPSEVEKISEAWAKVKVAIARQPRLARADVGVNYSSRPRRNCLNRHIRSHRYEVLGQEARGKDGCGNYQ